MYKKWQLNLLSSSMLLNLGLLSSVTLYLLGLYPGMKDHKHMRVTKWRILFSYMSILVVVITFIVISLFNFYRTLKSVCNPLILKCIRRYKKNSNAATGSRRPVEGDTISSSGSEGGGPNPFISVFDYREVQLGDLDES